MKKLLLLALTLVLAFSLALSLAACGNGDEDATQTPKADEDKTTLSGFSFNSKGFMLVIDSDDGSKVTKMWVNASTSESITYNYASMKIEDDDDKELPPVPSESDILAGYNEVNTTAIISDVSVEGTPSFYTIKFKRSDIGTDTQYITIYSQTVISGDTIASIGFMFTEIDPERPFASSFVED